MALKIERGLFTTDFVDYHAVLGAPIGAESKDIRKRYLKIARRLHPDSSSVKTEAEKQLAQELLSKLVNPAYEKLSHEGEMKEYKLLLELKGKQLNQQQDTVLISSPSAQKLASSGNVDQAYQAAIEELIKQQYDSLSDSLDLIGQISELNMVYLMRQHKISGPRGGPINHPILPTPPTPPTPPYPPTPPDPVERALNRAEEYVTRGEYTTAIGEIRQAIQLNPSHSKLGMCHSRLANIYLNTKQQTMAKICARKAVQLDPNDEVAKAILNRLEKQSPGNAEDPNKKKGGIFGLFGGKKR